MIDQRQPGKLPLYKQSKPLLLGATHSELACVLFHRYFVFFHTYSASSTCTWLLINAFLFFKILVSLLNSFFKEDEN